jgi:putative tricarboxylic transport membrane protein
MKRIKWDIYICLAIIIVLMLFASQLPKITPIARVYPTVVSIGTFICVLLLLVKTNRNPVDETRERMTAKAIKRTLTYLLLILAYILLWDTLGFIFSTLLFTVVSMHLLGMKNKAALIAFPILMTAVIYIVFTKLIMVSLPLGTLVENLM